MRELQVWKGIVLYESIWVRLPRYRSERDCRCRVFVILFYLGKNEIKKDVGRNCKFDAFDVDLVCCVLCLWRTDENIKKNVARFEERQKMHECQYKRKGVEISSEYQR